MNKSELINEVAKKAHSTKVTAQSVVDAFMEVVSEALERDEKVSLLGFGSFDTSHRREREGQNPQTGEKITIPGGKVVRFKQSKRLKERMNDQ